MPQGQLALLLVIQLPKHVVWQDHGQPGNSRAQGVVGLCSMPSMACWLHTGVGWSIDREI